MTPREVFDLVSSTLIGLADARGEPPVVVHAAAPFPENADNGVLRYFVIHTDATPAIAQYHGTIPQAATVEVGCWSPSSNPELAYDLANEVLRGLTGPLDAGGFTVLRATYTAAVPDVDTEAATSMVVSFEGAYDLADAGEAEEES